MKKYDSTRIKALFKAEKTHKEIASKVGCSIRTVEYHCCPNSKDKICDRMRRRYKAMTRDSLRHKLYQFVWKAKGKGQPPNLESVKSILNAQPACYLTGNALNLNDSQAYSLDHKVPVSRKGDCSIVNLGLCRADVNRAKADKTPDEFIALCAEVLRYAGFKVECPSRPPKHVERS
jgi:CRISPR/Cas system Type II protein with McrA/HNH and RuvC-like nuclease domain